MNNLILINISEYWGECGRYEDHMLGQYLVERTKDFDKKLRGLRKVCNNYEDWDEVETYVNNNFKVVSFDTRDINIGE